MTFPLVCLLRAHNRWRVMDPVPAATRSGKWHVARVLRLLIALGVLAMVALGFWLLRDSAGRAAGSAVENAVHSALTNPVEFAKSRVTGGVGVMLRTDDTTGVPIIQAVAVGSPAASAGLQAGDVITEVNGLATTGQNLKQIVGALTGFTGGMVTVTVKRAGTTNVTCTIRRSSWNNLRKAPFQAGPDE